MSVQRMFSWILLIKTFELTKEPVDSKSERTKRPSLSGSMVLCLVFSFNGLRIFFVGSTESRHRNRRSCAEQTAEQTAELSAEQSGGMQVDWGWVSDGWGTQAG
jgi:hypothetical protein